MPRASGSLEFDIPQRIVQKEIKGFSVVRGDFRKDFRFDRKISITIIRSEFDNFLLEEAVREGAAISEGNDVVGVDQDEQGVVVRTNGQSYRAKHFIIAEGAASRSASKVLGPRVSNRMAVGLSQEVETDIDTGDLFEVHLIDVPTHKLDWKCPIPLMGWMFPKRSGCNIGASGVGYSKTAMSRGASSIFEVCRRRYRIKDPERMSAHPIPISPRKMLHKGRILAIGDSAGFASPINGEGLAYAFMSARFAVEAIESAQIESGAKDSLRIYDKRCRDTIIRDMSAASLISPPLHWILGVIDVNKFIQNVDKNSRVVDVCQRMALGENDWRVLLKVGIWKFPELFFSSLN